MVGEMLVRNDIDKGGERLGECESVSRPFVGCLGGASASGLV